MHPKFSILKYERGVALLTTLAILTLATILIVGMMQVARINRVIAHRNNQNLQAAQLSQMALEQATATIRAATIEGSGSGKIWASQPGRITIVDAASGNTKFVPLYSTSTISGTDSVVDLNAAGFNGEHPIMTGTATPPRITAQWVNVLEDPEIAASNTNKLVGRYAFWVDDETTKININTADGGLKYTGSSYGPGTPAEVNLSAVFNNSADVNLITARSGIRSGTTTRAFNNINELLTLSGSASSDFKDTWRKHHGDLTHYNRAPEINIFGEPKIYLLTTVPGPAQGVTSGGPCSDRANYVPETSLGIRDLTGGGPIWQVAADGAGRLYQYQKITNYNNDRYSDIAKLSTPLTVIYPSSGRFVSNNTDRMATNPRPTQSTVPVGEVIGNQLPWFVPYSNNSTNENAAAVAQGGDDPNGKYYPNSYVERAVTPDYSPPRMNPPIPNNSDTSPYGANGLARSSTPIASAKGETLRLYPLPQYFTIGQGVDGDNADNTFSWFPTPFNVRYALTNKANYEDNYMIGHRIAQYLKARGALNQTLEWPRLAGGSSASGLTVFSQKYNDRQIDSIALQIVNMMSNSLYADLQLANRGGNQAGFSHQPLLARGFLSGEPVTGVGRGPKITAVRVDASGRLSEITDKNSDNNLACKYEVPELRLKITVEFTLPKLFAGYPLDQNSGKGSAWDNQANLWSFGAGGAPHDAGGAGGVPPISIINTQDAPGLMSLEPVAVQDPSTNTTTSYARGTVPKLSVFGAKRLKKYFKNDRGDELFRELGLVPGLPAGGSTDWAAIGEGPGMLGGFWMNHLLQVDISTDHGIIEGSFDLVGCAGGYRDPDERAEFCDLLTKYDTTTAHPLKNIIRHAYAANSAAPADLEPQTDGSFDLNGYIVYGSGTSDKGATPAFLMEPFWADNSTRPWNPGQAKKACNVYGETWYRGAALKNLTYNNVINQLLATDDPNIRVTILSGKPAVKQIFDKYGNSSKTGIARWLQNADAPNKYYGLGVNATSIRIHGGLAIWTTTDKTPLDSVRGPYFTGESIDPNDTITGAYSAQARERVLAAVIPIDLTVPLNGAEVTEIRYVQDPLVNKFPGDWQKFTSGGSGSLFWEAPAAQTQGRAAYIPTMINSQSILSDWLPEVSGSARPKIARLPNTGFLQYIHTGIIPDDKIDPRSTNVAYQNKTGTPYRILNFGNSSSGYPDWALLDLFTVPATLQPITSAPLPVTELIPLNQTPPPVLLTYGGASSGRVNPNAELITYDTSGASTAATPIYRTLPLQALFQNVAQNSYTSSGDPTTATTISASEAADIAQAIAKYQRENNNGRPFIVAGEITNASNNINADVLRQTVGNLTTRSNTFSVWTVAQSIKKSTANLNSRPNEFEQGDTVTGEVRMRYLIERYISTGGSPVAGNLTDSGVDRYPGTQDDNVDSESVSVSGTGRNLPKFTRYPLPYKYRVVYAEKITD